jgi:hypothetical protein
MNVASLFDRGVPVDPDVSSDKKQTIFVLYLSI